MPDAMMHFLDAELRTIPRSVMLKGEQWDFHWGSLNDGTGRVWFQQPQSGREIILWEGRGEDVQSAMRAGILVKSGTPARGLATALRRVGRIVELRPVG